MATIGSPAPVSQTVAPKTICVVGHVDVGLPMARLVEGMYQWIDEIMVDAASPVDESEDAAL